MIGGFFEGRWSVAAAMVGVVVFNQVKGGKGKKVGV